MVCDLTPWSLFAAAFVSTALFLAAREQHYDPWLLVAIAPFGNSLGAPGTWLLGGLPARRFALAQPRKPAQQRAVRWLRRRGGPLLLLSRLPLVGDPLCFGAWPVRDVHCRRQGGPLRRGVVRRVMATATRAHH